MATVRERIAAAKAADQKLTQTGGRSVRDRIAAAKEQERAFTQKDHVQTVSQVRQARKQSEKTVQPQQGGSSATPAWAKDMAGRYQPQGTAKVSPVAAWEDSRRAQAQARRESIPEDQRPDWGRVVGGTAYGGLQQAVKGVSATAAMAEQLVSRPLGWVLGNDQLYQDAPFYRLNQGMDREIAAHQAAMAPEYEKAGTAGKLMEKYGVPTVAAVPQAVLAFFTAGQNLAAQATAAGLQATSAAAQGAGIASTVGRELMRLPKDPQFLYSVAATMGGEYEQAKADGADDLHAYSYAALAGLLNSVVEVGGGIDQLPDGSKSALKEWVGSMLDEGKEEVVQGMISQLAQRAVYGKQNPYFSTTNEDAVVNPRRAAEEFMGGAVVGGVLGGAQIGVQRALTGPAVPVDDVRPVDGTAPVNGTAPVGDGLRAVPSQGQMEVHDRRAGTEPGPYGSRDSGLVQQSAALVDRKTARTLDNLGRAAGVSVEVVPSIPDLNGMYHNGRVYISADAKNPVLAVAKHELTHSFQTAAPEEYRAFRDLAVRARAEDGVLDKLQGIIREQYQSAGLEISEEAVLDEIAAEYAQNLLLDEKAVRKLAGENRGLLERLLDGLRAFLQKVKSVFTGEAEVQTAELEQGARLWEAALAQAGQNRTAADGDGQAPRFSFAGQNAQAADRAQLARAGELERQGRSAGDIRRETGWFRGMDGLWRFEIDDSGMAYDQRGDLGFRRTHEGYDRYRELTGRAEEFMLGLSDRQLTEAETAELRDLQKVWSGTFRQAGRVSPDALPATKLSDYIQHDALFRSYPQMRDMDLRFAGLEPGVNGSYDPRTNTITVSEELRSAPEDVILHEVQHAIQRAEGFAKGANWDYWNWRMEEGYVPPQEKARQERVEAALQTIREIEATAPKDFLSRLQEYKYLENYIASDEGVKDTAAWDRAEAVQTELEEQYGELFQRWFDADWERQMAEGSRTEVLPSTLYRNTAGEIEARDAAKRRTMTAEERRRTPPDLGDENTVFADGADRDASIGYDTENRPFVTVEEDILAGVDRKDWVRTVKENLRKKFPDGVTVGNSNIKINAKTTGEITSSEYSKWLRDFKPDLYADKFRATNNTDEILRASRDYINEEQRHPRKDNIREFARGTVQLRIGSADYTADVVVATTKGGSMVLYDLVNLQPTTISEKQTRTAATPTKEISDRTSTSASDETIPHPGGEVNPQTETDQYSRKGGEDLRAQVERLARLNRRLKEETARSGPGRPDRAAVDEQAKAILKEYESGYNKTALADRLEDLYRDFAAHTDGTLYERGKAPNMDQLRETARQIARDILAESATETNPLYEEYSELRKELRTRAIAVSGDVKQGMTEAWGDFRKQNMGRLKLGNQGTQVDVLYDELSGRFPEFFPEDIINPVDQLARLAEVAGELQSVTENQYEGEFDLNVEYLSGDLLERFYDTPNKPTFADKQAEKLARERARTHNVREARDAALERQKSQYQERMDRQREQWKKERERDRADRIKAVERQKERVAKRDEKIAELKERRKAEQTRRSQSKERTRLLNVAKRLSALKTTDATREKIDSYISDLDLVSKSITGKTVEKLTDLKAWYEDQKANNADFIADEVIEKKIARLEKKKIADMDLQDVRDLTDTLLNIENELRTQRRLLNDEDRRDTYRLGQEAAEHIRASKGASRGGVGAVLDRYIVTETLSPERYVRRLTGYEDADPLAARTRDLSRGQRAMFDYKRRAWGLFQKFVDDRGFMKRLTGKKAEAIKVTGLGAEGAVTVEITPDMRVSLYLHSLSSDNLRHIAQGGFTAPDMALYRKGDLAEAYARGTTVKLTPSQIRSIISRMTPQELEYANAISRDYFNGMSRQEINQTSETLKGYSLAREENYFPIDTDDRFLRQDQPEVKRDGSIEGMGFTKERVTNASSPIYLRDASSVLTRAIDQHAMYVGLAIPVRNFHKVYSVTMSGVDAEGNHLAYTGSVKQALESKWGSAATGYIDKMLRDLQPGGRGDAGKWGSFFGKVRSNYAGAVLTLNASVAMKQAASYPTAAAVLGWKPLARAMGDFGKVDLETINKYTPLLWYRSLGFDGAELGDVSAGKSAVPKALNWIQGIDVETTRKLWKASEYYVQENNRGLRKGSDAYYKAVADIYNRVIEETQPNYTSMQRPQLLRSENEFLKTISMFKTQPFQNANILYDATANYQAKRAQDHKTSTEASRQALRDARRDLGNAVSSQVVSVAVFAGMTALWNLFRHREDKYADEETGEVTAGSFFRRFLKDMLSSTAGQVPFGGEVYSAAAGLADKIADQLEDMEKGRRLANGLRWIGEDYYGLESVTTQALTDAVTAIMRTGDAVGATLTAVNDEGPKRDAWLSWTEMAEDVSKLFGIPAENVLNVGRATAQWVMQAAYGEALGDYYALAMTTKTSKKAPYYDSLWSACGKDRDAYRTIYKDLLELGFEADAISKAMEDRMKEELSVKSVSALPFRWAPPGEDRELDSLMDRAAKEGKRWVDLLPEGTVEAAQDLDALGSDASKVEKVRKAAQFGQNIAEDQLEGILSENEWEQFRAARKAGFSVRQWAELYEDALRAREKRTGKPGGAPSQEDVRGVLDRSGLPETKKKAFWESYGWERAWEE